MFTFITIYFHVSHRKIRILENEEVGCKNIVNMHLSDPFVIDVLREVRPVFTYVRTPRSIDLQLRATSCFRLRNRSHDAIIMIDVNRFT